MHSTAVVVRIALVGLGATLIMDVWLLVLARLGVPVTSFALVGRWVGHMAHGVFVHQSIAKAPSIRFELGAGWAIHYLIGMAYAALLTGIQGPSWLDAPTLLPALMLGASTVVAPWLVMQPAMGAGVLAVKTAAPMKNCLRNLLNHTIFGVGLYVAAALQARALE